MGVPSELLRPWWCGGGVCGSRRGTAGVFRNVSAGQSAYDALSVGFQLDGAATGTIMALLVVDGEVAGRAAGDEDELATANLGEGLHSVDLRTGRGNRPMPATHGAGRGQRAWLTWSAVDDADVRAYRVTQDGVLIATVDEVVIEVLDRAQPWSGSGTGRVSVFGAPTVEDGINEEIALEVDSTGAFSWVIGDESGSGVFGAGETVALAYGVMATFHDPPALSSGGGDTYLSRIGPRRSLLTDVLAPGSYVFRAAAVDEAGNASDAGASEARTVRVVAVPDGVTGVEIAYDDPGFTVTWTDPGDCDSVRVYANLNPSVADEHGLRPWVILDKPVAEIAAGTEEWASTRELTGTLLFYLRPVLDGIEREDLTLYRMTLPPTPADLGIVLGEPAETEVAATAGGDFLLSWRYRFEEDDAAALFHVYVSASTTFTIGTPTTTVAVSAGSGYPVGEFSVALDLNLASGTVRYFLVRAATTGSAVESLNEDYVSGTADATAPAAVERVLGAAQ